MADLAGCSFCMLKASENRFSMTSRILLKPDQIYFKRSIVQSIMQMTVRMSWKHAWYKMPLKDVTILEHKVD